MPDWSTGLGVHVSPDGQGLSLWICDYCFSSVELSVLQLATMSNKQFQVLDAAGSVLFEAEGETRVLTAMLLALGVPPTPCLFHPVLPLLPLPLSWPSTHSVEAKGPKFEGSLGYMRNT